MTGPVEFLEAAWRRAEDAVRELPPGPWQCAEVENEEGEHVTLASGVDTQAVFSAAWIWRHDGLDAYLPLMQPDAVLRRIANEREILADCTRALDNDHWAETELLAEDTIINLAKGWGWTEEAQ